MIDDTKKVDQFIARPSLPRNLLFALICVGFSAYMIQLAQADKTELLPAYLVAFLLTVGSVILLSSHLPNSSFLHLTKDGFEIRELFKSRYYLWSDVSRFSARRRLLGTTIEFVYVETTTGHGASVSLPTGYSISAFKLLTIMNEWRDQFSKSE